MRDGCIDATSPGERLFIERRHHQGTGDQAFRHPPAGPLLSWRRRRQPGMEIPIARRSTMGEKAIFRPGQPGEPELSVLSHGKALSSDVCLGSAGYAHAR
jgi:hypothetical protein